jgi:hypothetical protein
MANATPTIRCHDGASRKNKMPAMAHDCRASGEDSWSWNGRERTAFLKKQEERDRSSAYADAGKQRIVKTCSAEFLIPPSPKPDNRQIDQDR